MLNRKSIRNTARVELSEASNSYNMAPANDEMSEVEKDIFAKIANNDVNGLKNIIVQQKIEVDIYDENGMTPLQHAAYKGNKEIVQMLLDRVSVMHCTCETFTSTTATVLNSARWKVTLYRHV